MTTSVRYERTGPTAVLRLDRPERRNAIDGPMAEQIIGHIEAFEADDSARVLVVVGDDQAFCAGADLRALDTLAPRVGAPAGVFGTRRFPAKPAIAAISGWCLGAGIALATWCDLRVATATARFGFPDRKWGAPILDGATDRLVAIIGLGRSLDLVLTGRDITATDALTIGLVTEVVDDGRHLPRALELADLVASYPQATLLADRTALLDDVARRLDASAERDRRTLAAVAADAEQAAAKYAARNE